MKSIHFFPFEDPAMNWEGPTYVFDNIIELYEESDSVDQVYVFQFYQSTVDKKNSKTFKVYIVIIWYTYALWKYSFRLVNDHIHYLT